MVIARAMGRSCVAQRLVVAQLFGALAASPEGFLPSDLLGANSAAPFPINNFAQKRSGRFRRNFFFISVVAHEIAAQPRERAAIIHIITRREKMNRKF